MCIDSFHVQISFNIEWIFSIRLTQLFTMMCLTILSAAIWVGATNKKLILGGGEQIESQNFRFFRDFWPFKG